MEIAKLTSKGQLTLPISIRRQLGLDCGDKVAFMEKDGEFILVNVNRISVAKPCQQNKNQAAVENVIASMNFEGLELSDEAIKYMNDRQGGKITLEERIEQIKATLNSEENTKK
ncbi:MAG: hypothetical protein K2O08_01835 [Clostridia bacterium]|nr:hypothetical protein [Clostridia bacterium]